jgi:hypothetical protein
MIGNGACLMAIRQRQRAWAYCLGLLLVIAEPLRAAPPVLPPLNDPPAAQHLPGKFVWADLVAPDVEAARRFYGKLYGWSFRTIAGDGRRR